MIRLLTLLTCSVMLASVFPAHDLSASRSAKDPAHDALVADPVVDAVALILPTVDLTGSTIGSNDNYDFVLEFGWVAAVEDHTRSDVKNLFR